MDKMWIIDLNIDTQRFEAVEVPFNTKVRGFATKEICEMFITNYPS